MFFGCLPCCGGTIAYYGTNYDLQVPGYEWLEIPGSVSGEQLAEFDLVFIANTGFPPFQFMDNVAQYIQAGGRVILQRHGNSLYGNLETATLGSDIFVGVENYPQLNPVPFFSAYTIGRLVGYDTNFESQLGQGGISLSAGTGAILSIFRDEFTEDFASFFTEQNRADVVRYELIGQGFLVVHGDVSATSLSAAAYSRFVARLASETFESLGFSQTDTT